MKTISKNRKITTLIALFSIAAVTLTACGAQSSAQSTAPSASQDASKTDKPAAAQTNSQDDALNAAPAQSSFPTLAGGEYYGNTITVNSSESVTVVPDIAEVIYSVRTQAANAADCQKSNSEDVNKVTELLKGLGVAENSIQTSDYYMYPVYNYSGNTQRITGYEATTSLTVSSIPIDDLGNILEQSVAAGINNIQSITYQSSSYDEGYAQALKLAVASAKTKAQTLAEAGSCSIGNVVSINENSNYSQARYTDNALSSQINSLGYEKADAKQSSANVMPGEIDIEVNITVEYSILY